ncbi:MAG TPA: hypothetical protein VLB86_02000 [Gaiellaceae bacterium]|nr:hypothetical protein [Gaiellaceae bacterium]
MRAAAAALVAVALVTAGCGGGDAEDAAGAAVAPVAGVPAPAVGRALVAFVGAAGEGDADATWALLSPETRASMGPTLPEFRRGVAADLEQGLGDLAGRAEVVLARRVGRWGLAAVAGERVVEGEREHYAYAAAFRLVRGEWRVELGGAVAALLEPGPLDETDAEPEIGVKLDASGPLKQALMWLDDRPQAVRRRDEGPFSARLSGRVDRPLAPGFHTAVALATTPDTAAAAAWPFEVRG